MKVLEKAGDGWRQLYTSLAPHRVCTRPRDHPPLGKRLLERRSVPSSLLAAEGQRSMDMRRSLPHGGVFACSGECGSEIARLSDIQDAIEKPEKLNPTVIALRVLSDWDRLGQATPALFSEPSRRSLASLRGRRSGRHMMGSGERGVSICFTTLPSFGRQVRDSRRDRLARRPHGTIQASPFRAKALFVLRVPLIGLGSRRPCGKLLSKAELGRVGPHTVQNDRQFACHRHTGARHAAAPGDDHAPSPEAGPFLRAHQQRVGGLVEGRCGRVHRRSG